jgi:hypothetical protein
MDRMRIPRKALELKFKGKRPMRQPIRWFSQVLEDIKKREMLARNQKGKTAGKQKRLETFHPSACIKWKQC